MFAFCRTPILGWLRDADVGHQLLKRLIDGSVKAIKFGPP
jgi:hypothetical protein